MHIGIVEVFKNNGTRLGGFKPMARNRSIFPSFTGDTPFMLFKDTDLEKVLNNTLSWHIFEPPHNTELKFESVGNGYYNVTLDNEDRWVSVNRIHSFIDCNGEAWEIYKLMSSSNMCLNGSREHHIGSSIEMQTLREMDLQNLDSRVVGFLEQVLVKI